MVHTCNSNIWETGEWRWAKAQTQLYIETVSQKCKQKNKLIQVKSVFESYNPRPLELAKMLLRMLVTNSCHQSYFLIFPFYWKTFFNHIIYLDYSYSFLYASKCPSPLLTQDLILKCWLTWKSPWDKMVSDFWDPSSMLQGSYLTFIYFFKKISVVYLLRNAMFEEIWPELPSIKHFLFISSE